MAWPRPERKALRNIDINASYDVKDGSFLQVVLKVNGMAAPKRPVNQGFVNLTVTLTVSPGLPPAGEQSLPPQMNLKFAPVPVPMGGQESPVPIRPWQNLS